MALTTPSSPDAVRRAQYQLGTLHYRVRRQIGLLDELPDLQSSMVRDAARTLGDAARWLIPKVVGVAAGAIVEAHAPGTGTGFVVGKTVAKVADDGLTWAATSVIGWIARTDPPAPPPPPDIPARDPAQLHEAALDDQLRTLRQAIDYVQPDELVHYRELLRRARRHLARLRQLAADRDLDRAYGDYLVDRRRELDKIAHHLEWMT